MKKILITALLSFIVLFTANAQSGYTYIDFAAGLMIKNHTVGELSYEWAGRYYNGNEIFVEYAVLPLPAIPVHNTDGSLTYFDQADKQNFLIGYVFKPLITRNKNVALNLRLGGSMGTDTEDFIASLHAGFELNFFTRSGTIIFLRQKSQAVFFDNSQWRIGLLAGIKIPLKKD